MYEWLDEKIKEQKHNIDIMNKVARTFTPAQLQETAEQEDFEN